MQLGSTQCRQWGRAPSPVCSQCERAQGSRKRHPGVAGPVLGSPPSPGPVRVWIRSSWSPEKQTQGHGSPLTATGSSWKMELLGGVAVGEEGTVALGALGQDWTQRHLSGGTHPPTPALPVPFGAPSIAGPPTACCPLGCLAQRVMPACQQG